MRIGLAGMWKRQLECRTSTSDPPEVAEDSNATLHRWSLSAQRCSPLRLMSGERTFNGPTGLGSACSVTLVPPAVVENREGRPPGRAGELAVATGRTRSGSWPVPASTARASRYQEHAPPLVRW
jgi:hypothetical protein